MRLAIILALALAACTGKNAAKGTVKYVPVVPLSVLEGAGGEQAEPDAAAEADAAVENEDEGGAPEVDAGADAGDDAAEADAAGPACVETAWTDGHPRELDETRSHWDDCESPCNVIAACSIFYVDENNQRAECPCLSADDRPRIFDECMTRCTHSREIYRFFAFSPEDAACHNGAVGLVAEFGETEPGQGISAACRGTAE